MNEVACGIMFYQGKVLMGLRPDDRPYGGYWEFPGGSLERGETIQECLQREWVEELNLKIEIDKEIHVSEIDKYRCRFFIGQIPDISALQRNVHSELRFVDLDEIKDLKLFEADYQIITLPEFVEYARTHTQVQSGHRT